MSLTEKKGLLERVRRGKAARDRLVENNLSEGIAFQIAATRDKRGWTQARLAEEADIANNLPRLEDPEYGKHTISTLKKLASALDVALVVRFVPFGQYIDWLSGTPHEDKGIGPEAMAVPSFDDEEKSGHLDAIVRLYAVNINDGVTPVATKGAQVMGIIQATTAQKNTPFVTAQYDFYHPVLVPVEKERVVNG